MSLFRGVKTLLGSGSSSHHSSGFTTARTETDLFPATQPDVDGEECLRDCDSCTTHYPKKFSVDESDKLYGHVKGWNTHLVVGTGQSDWVRDVTDIKHSVMHAVGKAGIERENGKIMLSASNMPSGADDHDDTVEQGTSDCMLLPSWVMIEKVAPSQVDKLLVDVIEQSVTNETPLAQKATTQNGHAQTPAANGEGHTQENGDESSNRLDHAPVPASISSSFTIKPIPHDYIILMCSHKTRDARCGQSAPLLRKEFERILRPMGMYRDMHDERPGGVGIYFINHVGGHKYSANVMIYRREGRRKDGTDEEIDGAPLAKEAVQLIWLARVRPEDCENIVRYTVLQGKVVKPKSQLRGGFDRERGLTSW
ncbi:hypothetical protein RBB50_005958 [Rhinocladiella similis]